MSRYPAARIGDVVTHDMLMTCGIIVHPSGGPCARDPVLIEGLHAAHVLCNALCLGVTVSGPIFPHPPAAPMAVPIPCDSSGGSQSNSDAARGSQSGTQSDDEDEVNAMDEFEFQVLEGEYKSWHFLGQGRANFSLKFRITDSKGNAAIYSYSGSGPKFNTSPGWVDKVIDDTSVEIFEGEPVPFRAPRSYSAGEFAGIGWTQRRVGVSKVRFVVEPSKEGKPPIALFHPLAPPISRVIDIEELHLEREKMILPVLEEWNSAGTVELVEYIPQQCPVPLPSPTINPIIKGSATVFIHGLPAARWLVSGDVSMCGAVLGSFPQYPRRTVWIGG